MRGIVSQWGFSVLVPWQYLKEGTVIRVKDTKIRWTIKKKQRVIPLDKVSGNSFSFLCDQKIDVYCYKLLSFVVVCYTALWQQIAEKSHSYVRVFLYYFQKEDRL